MQTVELKTVSTIDAVRDMLEQDIYSLYFPPGAKITENDLAVRYGISRNTLREAISYLLINGLLIKIPNKGIFVKEISIEDIEEIFHLRALLEGEAIREIMKTHEIPSALAVAADAVFKIDPHEDWYANMKADINFHEQLVRSAGNARLIQLYECILAEVKLCIYQSRGFTAVRPANANHHLQILKNMHEGNIDGALEVLNEHIDSAIQSYTDGFLLKQ